MPTNPYQPPGTENCQEDRPNPAGRKRLWIAAALVALVVSAVSIFALVRMVNDIYDYYGKATRESRERQHRELQRMVPEKVVQPGA
jgi:hypothetical protein